MAIDSNFDHITETVLKSIANLFSEPDFDSDGGEVKFLERDVRCVWLGLFPTNEEGEPISDTPTVTWTIEVSHDRA